jgi:putative membrane protein
MVDYNPKEWLRFIFFFPKGDTTRKLAPFLISIGLYSTLIAYFIIDFWQVGQNSDLKNISLMHSLLGFVISMLLVFRTNTAYDRWWEGRKQWGALVNITRNLAIKLHTLLPDRDEDVRFFQAALPNYAFALKNHLRNEFVSNEFEETRFLSLGQLQQSNHLPNQIARSMFDRIYTLQKDGVLLPEHLLLLNHEFESFTNICGACERIRNTPIPFSYSSFLKKFIFIYCITLPLGYVFSLHYLVIPFAVFVFYILGSLETIAEEIEDPFGIDSNDLPLEDICRNIKKSTADIFQKKP